MSEEKTSEDLDLAKVQDFIKGQVETFAKEAFEKQTSQRQSQPTLVQTGQPTQEELAHRQLQDVLTPFIKPGFDAMRLETADTRDFVDFYNNPNVQEDKEAVEAMFQDLKQKGRPLPRQDIYDYLQGKMAREKPQEFNKKITERQRRQTESAISGVDVGLAGLDRARNDPTWSNVRNMPLAELEKALEGVTF